jgi:predicted DNA-binding transcriptional regulator AlpA
MKNEQAYLPAAAVRARYGVSDMSLWRWLRDEALRFPAPIRINNRRFWRLAELEKWESSRAEGGAHASAAQ